VNPTGFSGFPRLAERSVNVPDVFFLQLVPQIRSIVELKVTLHLMWTLSRQTGRPRCIEYRDLAEDRDFVESLKVEDGPRPAIDYLREGLELAVTRGSVLHAVLHRGDVSQTWYFLNTVASREALAALQTGEYERTKPALGPEPIDRVRVFRPNVFALYEQNIGPLTPIVAERLRDAETQYPAGWMEAAIGLAVEYNRRSWRYVEAILRRWVAEGRDDIPPGGESDPNSYFRTKYEHIYR
jgi:DnaD/phage-associated family protein